MRRAAALVAAGAIAVVAAGTGAAVTRAFDGRGGDGRALSAAEHDVLATVDAPSYGCSGPCPTAGPTAATRGDVLSGTVSVTVWLVDAPRYARGATPYLVPVTRRVPANDVAGGVVRALWTGPTAAERARGLAGVPATVPGPPTVTVDRGAAVVKLPAGCSVDRSVPVGEMVQESLRGLPDVGFVKVYDRDGTTERPRYDLDSLPTCLDIYSGRVRYLEQQYDG